MKYRILNNSPLDFYDSTATLIGTIAANGSNLKISASSGVIELGNTATDIQVGTNGTAINWTFLGGGTIGAAGTNTLSIGQAGDTINMNVASVTYQLPSSLVRYTDLTATNNRINITTQVPGTINFSLPDRPIVPYLLVNGGGVSSSNTTGALQVIGGVGVSGSVYSNNFIVSSNTFTGYQVRLNEGGTGGPRLDFGTAGSPTTYMSVGAYSGLNNIDNNTRDLKIGSTTVTNIIYANNSTGYVGVGTASPGYKLHVYTTGRSTDGIRVQSTTGGEIGIAANVGAGSWNSIVQANDAVITFHSGTQNNGNLTIGPWTSGPGSGIRIGANGYLSMTTNSTFISGDTTIVGNLSVTGTTAFVQPAFNQANNAFNVANVAYTQANNAASFANGAFTAANVSQAIDNTQNTNISSAQSFANGAFTQANNAASFANGAFTAANVSQAIDNTQNTNISSAQSFANGAFTQANNAASFANGAFTAANVSQAIDNTQNTNISSAQSYANSAFTKANNALANTTGTFAGDLTITGNLFVNGTTTTVNTQTLLVGDNLIVLNSDIPVTVPAPSIDSGIEINRGLYQNTQLVWSEVSNAWRMSDGNTFASIASANLTQAAFGQANNAFNVANVAYTQANNGSSFANGAFTAANVSQAIDNTQNTIITSAQSFANGAFTTANSAASFANGAFTAANVSQAIDNTQNTNISSAQSFANGAFTQANNAASFANGAFTAANVSQAIDNTQNTNISSAQSFANGAFAKANAAYDYANTISASSAQGAFDRANSAYGQANSAASFANGAFVTANSAASFANGAFTAANVSQAIDNTQNTNISSAQSFANGAFVTANSAASFANGAFAKANAAYDYANTISASSAQGAFDRANSAYGQANSASSFANGAFTQANNAASFANSAFNMANNSVITLTSNNQNQITTNSSMGNIVFGLAATGVVAGSYAYYTNFQVDAYGRLTTTTASTILEPMGNSAYAFANTGYTQANNAASFANGAFVTANSAASFANGAFTAANVSQAIDNTQNTNISSAQSYANGAFTAANVAFGRIQITANTGDLLANGVNTPVTGNILLGLATTGVSAGTYGGASQQTIITVDAKGRITYAANVASGGGGGGGDSLANTGTSITANGLSVYTFANTTAASANNSGAVTVRGGVSVTGNVVVGSSLLVINSTTNLPGARMVYNATANSIDFIFT